MSIHCHGETHGFVGLSNICVCGASAWTFNGSITVPVPNPPHHPRASQLQPQPQPQPQPAANDVPLVIFKAAIAAGASHISPDGVRAYRERYGSALVCFWSNEAGEFGSWFQYLADIPADAVRVED